jgi:hypothetical protein
MSLTITYDPKNDFSVLTDDDERVCLPYGLNNLPAPRLEKRDARGNWVLVKTLTRDDYLAWGAVTDPKTGKPRIPLI